MRGLLSILIWFGCVSLVLAATPTNNPATPEARPPAPSDTLVFLNGDMVHGTFLSLEEKGGVRWLRSCIRPVMTVDLGGLSKVILPAAKAKPRTRSDCVVRLANGDELTGNLVALDDKALTLDTWYAGALTLARPGLAALSVGLARLNAVYEGPTSPDGWTFKGNTAPAAGPGQAASGWQYKDGAFCGYGAGSLGRDVKLPRTSSLEFDLAWRGSLQLILFFYTDNLQGYGGNAYALHFNQRNLTLQRLSRSGASSELGALEVPALGRSQARVALRTDRENKTIALLVDENLVKQWADNNDFKDAGTGLQFLLQGGSQAVKVSNLRVTEWDGRLDDLSAVASRPGEDLVRLANKDKMSGAIKGIRDGKVQLATAFAKLELPLDRINLIEFAAARLGTNAPASNEMRVFFADRGRLTMRVERWDDQQMAGSSPHFGKARFLPWAFSALQFNLGKPMVDTDSLDPDLNVPVGGPEVLVEE